MTLIKTGGWPHDLAPKLLVGCKPPVHYLEEAVSYSRGFLSHHLESPWLSGIPLGSFGLSGICCPLHTFSALLAIFASQ